MPESHDVKKWQLAKWIECDVLAENILDALEENGLEPTLENAKRLWLDFLKNELWDGLSLSAERLVVNK